jgi:hypothetical protein
VSWVEGFIVFSWQLSFGMKKAWHIATQLGKRILEEISMPQNGVSNSFEAGNNEQVCQHIVWVVLKNHHIIARYK